MIDWNSIIWFVIWAAVALVGGGLIIWGIVAVNAARLFRETSKDFNKGFDSDFFKSHR